MNTKKAHSNITGIWAVSIGLICTLFLGACTPTENANLSAGNGETTTQPEAGNTNDSATAEEDGGEEVEITFDLPEEWRPAERAPGKLAGWSTYIPDPPETVTTAEAQLDEREQQHSWKFTLNEVSEDWYEATTAEGMATEYHEEYAAGCLENPNCEIEPVAEKVYGETTVYYVKDYNTSDEVIYSGEFYSGFFKKDGIIFELGIRGDMDSPITEETIESVVTTMKIKG